VKRGPDIVRTGFTLVELIWVVAVLAVLVSIVIPKIGWDAMGKIQVEIAARKFSDYLKLARSLAITHASSNSSGYMVVLSELKVKQVIKADILAVIEPVKPKPVPLSYTSYRIINVATSEVVKGPTDVPEGVTCTGNSQFQFTPLGQLQGGSTLALQFTKSGDTKVVTVTPIGRITVQ
jgi:prepilin-type N-terminal cleavage/methylation domain-containing protein